MRVLTLAVLLASSTVIQSLPALAMGKSRGEYPMSGIDTRLKLEPGVSSIVLTDKDGKPLELHDGGAYRLRFSNKSSSFHIMAGGGNQQEFKVDGGFPNNDLRNFQLSGAKFGNPNVGVLAETRDENLGSSSRTDYSTCTYVCGSELVCHTETRQECTPIKRWECTGEGTNRICDNDRVCVSRPEQVCISQPRSCSGTNTYEVTETSFQRVFEMAVEDSSTRARLAEFSGEIKSWSEETSRRLIGSTCY